MARTIAEAGLQIIKDSESLQLRAYQDSGGVWTIGWGHTGDVHEGDVITEHEAEALIRADLAGAEECVNRYAPGVNQNQFDALVSLSFNCGCAPLSKFTIGRLVRAGDYNAAAAQFGVWNHDNGKVLAGLTKRRAAEAKLFLTPDPDFSNVESGVTTTAPEAS
jgi:lysozyme